VEHFIRTGNDLIICGRRENKLNDVKEKRPDFHIKVCDISREDERKNLIDWMVKK
jgi:uncharacterized oxidoreductase